MVLWNFSFDVSYDMISGGLVDFAFWLLVFVFIVFHGCLVLVAGFGAWVLVYLLFAILVIVV